MCVVVASQIIPPHDQGIADAILENLEPEFDAWDVDMLNTSTLCEDPTERVTFAYYCYVHDTARVRLVGLC